MRFIGRKRKLKEIEDFVFNSKNPILYLFGTRGTGKTSLLLQFLEKNKNRINNNYFYLHGSDYESNISNLISNDKHLIIIDDFDLIYENNIFLFKDIADNYPKRKIIVCTSKIPLNFNKEIAGRIQFLELKGLLPNEVDRLISNRLSIHPELDTLTLEQLSKYFNNNPGLISTSIDYLIHNKKISVINLIELLENPLQQTGIIDLNGNPVTEESNTINQVKNKILIVNNSLLDKAYYDPDFIYKIKPYQFEELVAELLEREGFNVNLTKKTHDGGKDIFIAQNNTLGNFLYYVECKQFSPNNHVGVKLVRELYGTVSADRATAGILVTTSYFSKQAIDFVENVRNRLSLKNYLELRKWINDTYLRINGS